MDDHKQVPWHASQLSHVYEVLETSEEGLSDAEADKRLKENGRNELRTKPPRNHNADDKRADHRSDDPDPHRCGGPVGSPQRVDGSSGDLHHRYRQRSDRDRAGKKGPVVFRGIKEDERSHCKGNAPGRRKRDTGGRDRTGRCGFSQ